VTRRQLLVLLRREDACPAAIKWVRQAKGSPAALWRRCRRGMWMAWLVDLAKVEWNDHVCPDLGGPKCASLIRKQIPWARIEEALTLLLGQRP
jgi:hypothetical protein